MTSYGRLNKLHVHTMPDEERRYVRINPHFCSRTQHMTNVSWSQTKQTASGSKCDNSNLHGKYRKVRVIIRIFDSGEIPAQRLPYTYSTFVFDGISRGTCLISVHLTLTQEEPNLAQAQFFGQALSLATTIIRIKRTFFRLYMSPRC